MEPFAGVLAMVGVPSKDGRTLGEPRDPISRPLVQPILSIATGQLVGCIYRVWLDGKILRFRGELSEDAGSQVRQKLALAHLDVDADGFTQTDQGMELIRWQVTGAHLGRYEDRAWDEMYMTMSVGGDD